MKVLVAEDEKVSRRLLSATLTKWGYEVVTAANGEDAMEILQGDEAPRFVILDWMMPKMDGIQVCREARKNLKETYIYIILLTARKKKEDIVEAMNAGADDYMTKPFDPCELEVRMRAGRRILELQEELVSALEGLRIQATHDPLTGLWNRGAILDILERELARCERGGMPIAIAMADLDHFKQVNDAHGHIVGDAVLCEAARRLKSSVRPYDAIGRYGGEEFLVVLPECDEPGVASAAERLRVCVENGAFKFNDEEYHVSVSIGATSTRQAKRADAETLIQAADKALYEAKEKGRNRIEVKKPRPHSPPSLAAQETLARSSN